MYSFKLKGNKCLFKDGNFYVRKNPIIYISNINTVFKHLIP